MQIQSITATMADLSTRSELHEIAHTIVEQHEIDTKGVHIYLYMYIYA
jgi:thiamine biosynthesis protein ThiC